MKTQNNRKVLSENRMVEYVAFESTCNINGGIIFFKDEERNTYEDGTVRKEFKYHKQDDREYTSARRRYTYKDEASFRNAIKRIASDKNITLIKHKYINR